MDISAFVKEENKLVCKESDKFKTRKALCHIREQKRNEGHILVISDIF